MNDELWSQLGGKQPYIDETVIKDVGEEQEPRLFHGSNASGNFKRTLMIKSNYSRNIPSIGDNIVK